MITDNTAKWKAVKLTEFAGKSLPVGFMHFSLEKEVPAGELPASGYLYNRILYADLWKYAQDNDLVISESEWQAIASANSGNCAYYSSGDGSTTFRVPKLPNTLVTDASNGEVPVYGNGITIGLTNGTTNGGLQSMTFKSGISQSAELQINGAVYGKNVGSIGTESDGNLDGNKGIGLTTDPTKSGIVAQTSATKITGQWLIVAFGVAHNIGEADVANVMQAVEQVQTSVGTLEQGVGTAIDYIIESYRNGTEWYEIYKSGKVRQGGSATAGANGTGNLVTFHLPFADKDYDLRCFIFDRNGTANFPNAAVLGAKTRNASNTGFYVSASYIASGSSIAYNAYPISWVAEGQGA